MSVLRIHRSSFYVLFFRRLKTTRNVQLMTSLVPPHSSLDSIQMRLLLQDFREVVTHHSKIWPVLLEVSAVQEVVHPIYLKNSLALLAVAPVAQVQLEELT